MRALDLSAHQCGSDAVTKRRSYITCTAVHRHKNRAAFNPLPYVANRACPRHRVLPTKPATPFRKQSEPRVLLRPAVSYRTYNLCKVCCNRRLVIAPQRAVRSIVRCTRILLVVRHAGEENTDSNDTCIRQVRVIRSIYFRPASDTLRSLSCLN